MLAALESNSATHGTDAFFCQVKLGLVRSNFLLSKLGQTGSDRSALLEDRLACVRSP
jgi:hypothetical protein